MDVDHGRKGPFPFITGTGHRYGMCVTPEGYLTRTMIPLPGSQPS